MDQFWGQPFPVAEAGRVSSSGRGSATLLSLEMEAVCVSTSQACRGMQGEWRMKRFPEVPDSLTVIMWGEEQGPNPDTGGFISGWKEEKLHQMKIIPLQGYIYESKSWFRRQVSRDSEEERLGWIGAMHNFRVK